jgi:hypothetical protein
MRLFSGRIAASGATIRNVMSAATTTPASIDTGSTRRPGRANPTAARPNASASTQLEERASNNASATHNNTNQRHLPNITNTAPSKRI